ncbi:MAG: hypothetical protein ACK5EU_01255 [Pseudanabaena sp.]|uniref:hypothetical protein n=1 Tax=Pseudanabaena mucicola TaxID=71190 RepID=UPI00257696B4|nr:hypothetical protein [Pseudanabaena mucicola]MCA6573039.1 hypothetical protein [Pseudanabaena sp. M53BS1SP1A06MG]MCA6580616.1 hypothetical protein [Pseudanabaena sp. M34BS1SP1A06MG]MCA6586466.1 hypothetical protein [Pseudanabaena sp. M051S1SP1A06QC]MCA6590509.1 hypothetical protein [Pseudanabaena sp. M109S1SP1A06QC]MCA6597994.1 hypothetical protein [Pseudanabaena sp. M046S1SP1A06QC]MCA6615070.1 hypothetical protein [Pseudanabaena sp. M090S1SP1A06QC]MCE2977504.1 hypothetical protein [Pseud
MLVLNSCNLRFKCASVVEAASPVLQAINLPKNLIEGALRISFDKFSTDVEIDRAANILIAAVHRTQQIIQS